MSLPAIAKQLEAKGRHGDTNLVHVSDSELKGLHAIAAAHGKKITINPETGLPEAFSLKSFLPTVIGAGLAMTGIGAPLAAGLVGAGYGVATGSLQKGLMAGLGAYGGAGLTGSLMGAAATPAAAAANPQLAAAAPTTMPPVTAAMTGNQVQALQTAGGPSGNLLAAGNLNPQTANLLYNTPISPTVSQAASQVAPKTFMETAASNWDKAATGAKNIYSGGWDTASKFLGENKMNIGTALAPVLTDALTPSPSKEAPREKAYIRPYEYDPGATNASANVSNVPFAGSSEQIHFNPVFTAKTPYEAPGPEYAAKGGIVGMAVGGQVERDAVLESVGMNAKYPMAEINMPMYSSPGIARPMADEVVNPAGDVGVDEFTGAPRMANGGIAKYSMGGSASALMVDPKQVTSMLSTSGSSSGGNPNASYSFNPQTQEFTELTRPTPNYGNGLIGRLIQSMQGYDTLPAALTQGNRMETGGPLGLLLRTAHAYARQQQPATTSRVTGGIAAPYIPSQQPQPQPQQQNMANGGIAGDSHLGGYSDGGRLLKGPGDGVSDSIPASIGNRQPARLADGEFVVPARIVSELGNGSTEAGARKLYAMMDRVQKGRKKTVGKGKVAVNSRADKHLPA